MTTAPVRPVQKKHAWIRVDRREVAAVFKEHYPKGPWPTELQCYHLANAIDIVRNKDLPPVNNATPLYRERRRVVDAIFALIDEQMEFQQFSGLRLPNVVRLEQLREALKSAESALLSPANLLAGERKGAEWHWPAHFLAGYVESTLRIADRKKKYRNKKISRDKRGRFVLVVAGALALADLEGHSPDAIAAVLQKKATI